MTSARSDTWAERAPRRHAWNKDVGWWLNISLGPAVRARWPQSQVDGVLAGPDYAQMFAPAAHHLNLDFAVFAAKFPGWNSGWQIS